MNLLDAFRKCSICRKKRKKDCAQVVIEAVMKYFGYNRNKAKEAIRILSPEQIEDIKEKNNGGGV